MTEAGKEGEAVGEEQGCEMHNTPSSPDRPILAIVLALEGVPGNLGRSRVASSFSGLPGPYVVMVIR
jgi:hypothetical protein